MTSKLVSETTTLEERDLALLRAAAYRRGIVLERDELCVLGFGSATVISLENGLGDASSVGRASRALAALALSRASGAELPLAIAALPFQPDSPATLVVPELTVTATPSDAVAVALGRPADVRKAVTRHLETAGDGEPERPPDRFELVSARPHTEYLARVAHARDEVRSGRLVKVVLAREVRVSANRPFRQADLLERLRSLHPSCLTFAVDGFVGATPELLVRRAGRSVLSTALAGTAARSGAPEADRRAEQALLSSQKERVEHRPVVEAIAAALAPVTDSLQVPDVPEIVELRNVAHLRTRIAGTLSVRADGTVPSVLELLARIHPTPAIAGTPVDVALEYLAKTEDLERGPYGGAVGFLRADGDGEFHLGIRSAIVEDDTARLIAGGGIVAESDPEEELRETQLKLQAMLAAVVRP